MSDNDRYEDFPVNTVVVDDPEDMAIRIKKLESIIEQFHRFIVLKDYEENSGSYGIGLSCDIDKTKEYDRIIKGIKSCSSATAIHNWLSLFLRLEYFKISDYYNGTFFKIMDIAGAKFKELSDKNMN
jgi:hypothetical protein